MGVLQWSAAQPQLAASAGGWAGAGGGAAGRRRGLAALYLRHLLVLRAQDVGHGCWMSEEEREDGQLPAGAAFFETRRWSAGADGAAAFGVAASASPGQCAVPCPPLGRPRRSTSAWSSHEQVSSDFPCCPLLLPLTASPMGALCRYTSAQPLAVPVVRPWQAGTGHPLAGAGAAAAAAVPEASSQPSSLPQPSARPTGWGWQTSIQLPHLAPSQPMASRLAAAALQVGAARRQKAQTPLLKLSRC